MISELERAVLTYYSTGERGARQAKELSREFGTGSTDAERSGIKGSVFEGFNLAEVKEVREAYVTLNCIHRRGQTSSAMYYTLQKGLDKLG